MTPNQSPPHAVAANPVAALAPHAPKVFTPPFLIRLRLINRAERELRIMGYTVVWSRLAGPVPQLHIQRNAGDSIAPLLDRAESRSYRTHVVAGHTMASCEFAGVQVSWEQE